MTPPLRAKYIRDLAIRGRAAGLVVITPACGFANSTGAVIIGVLAGGIPYMTVSLLKPALKYDDALDTFGVHAVGGTLGALVTGILATKEVNSNLKDDLLATLFRSQLSAIAVTLVLSTCATAVIALILKAVLGLRPSPVDFIPKVLMLVIVADTVVESAVKAIVKAAKTGEIGDGLVFISTIDDALRIRTEEEGEKAI
jgi:nitrogen regulatory protein PII